MRGRVWDIATTYQLRYSIREKKNHKKPNTQGNTAAQPYSRPPQVGQVSCSDALHVVWDSTLVKPTERQGFVRTFNNTLPLACHHSALPRADADDTYPC